MVSMKKELYIQATQDSWCKLSTVLDSLADQFLRDGVWLKSSTCQGFAYLLKRTMSCSQLSKYFQTNIVLAFHSLGTGGAGARWKSSSSIHGYYNRKLMIRTQDSLRYFMPKQKRINTRNIK